MSIAQTNGKRKFQAIEREMNDKENYLMKKVRSRVWRCECWFREWTNTEREICDENVSCYG